MPLRDMATDSCRRYTSCAPYLSASRLIPSHPISSRPVVSCLVQPTCLLHARTLACSHRRRHGNGRQTPAWGVVRISGLTVDSSPDPGACLARRRPRSFLRPTISSLQPPASAFRLTPTRPSGARHVHRHLSPVSLAHSSDWPSDIRSSRTSCHPSLAAASCDSDSLADQDCVLLHGCIAHTVAELSTCRASRLRGACSTWPPVPGMRAASSWCSRVASRSQLGVCDAPCCCAHIPT
jgi:hypothetical protein